MIKPSDIHILIIDDDPLTAKAVAANFEVFDFKVSKLNSTRDALQFLASHSVQIVILDWNMPNGGGLGLLQKIRNNDWEKPAIFLMTGDNNVKAEKVFDMGADGLLRKPFNVSESRNLIQQSCLSRNQRWVTPYRKEIKYRVNKKISSIVKGNGELLLGSGGFFVSETQNLPSVGDAIEFLFHVDEDELCRKISGKGIVRWVRPDKNHDGPSGYGVEIKFLEDMGRELFIEWVETNRPKQHIPSVAD